MQPLRQKFPLADNPANSLSSESVQQQLPDRDPQIPGIQSSHDKYKNGNHRAEVCFPQSPGESGQQVIPASSTL